MSSSLNVRFESSMIPSYLTEGTGAKFWPRKGTLTSRILLNSCRIPNKMSLVLLGLMSSLLVQHQEDFSQSGVNVLERERKVNVGLIDI